MGIFSRRETPAQDRARTDRFLDSVDQDDQGDDFEDVIQSAAAAEVISPYPPPGHGYPRR